MTRNFPLIMVCLLLLLTVVMAVTHGSGLAGLLGAAGAGCFAISAFALRNPDRVIPAAPLAVVGPGDGRIVSVQDRIDPWLQRPARRVRIKIRMFDVHHLRSPTEGKVLEVWARDSSALQSPRRYAYWVQTDEADDIVVEILAGRVAPLVRIDMQAGERIGQGQRCGFLCCSGFIDLYLPETARLEVTEGLTVRAGETIVGQIVHRVAERTSPVDVT